MSAYDMFTLIRGSNSFIGGLIEGYFIYRGANAHEEAKKQLDNHVRRMIYDRY